MHVPFLDLTMQHRALRRELIASWEETLDSASFIGGANVESFEKAFALFCETRHAIGVANGTDALILALKALGIQANDEVILPANSFVATAEAVVNAGAAPIFADIDRRTYNIDPEDIGRRVTPRTKAIIAVHLYGQPAEMNSILSIANGLGLPVIEDCAQAHGATYFGRKVGSMGTVGCFSFYPGKNLGACGDAGAVVTNDATVAAAVRKLRDHGGIQKYQHDVVGVNSRLDSLQASALSLKLPLLSVRNATRRRNAQLYTELLASIDGIVTPVECDGAESVYHLYVIRIENRSRDSLQQYLSENGVQTGIHYPVPIHRTKAFAGLARAACPVAERYAAQILSLPMYPELTRDQLHYVAATIGNYRQTASDEPAAESAAHVRFNQRRNGQ